ncbi:hypothetical protein GUJ93_ZPchr0013g37066 [Zizania palustris]|uniref:Uncharacterized protein n=1 Tax=Zizania palustris TaxID=103762 RepID=A0A8J6BW03_ZIZPA|nr:hypothetical protein GUJ93_ZPchr0013g37066 [Zizania palustris]
MGQSERAGCSAAASWGGRRRPRRGWLACVVVAFLAVLSPLYVHRQPAGESDEEEDGVLPSALWLPALLVACWSSPST